MIAPYQGYKIIEDLNMVEYYEQKIKRTFFERLFSLSWFTKYKIITKSKPKSEVIVLKDCLVMHPETALKLSREVKNERD